MIKHVNRAVLSVVKMNVKLMVLVGQEIVIGMMKKNIVSQPALMMSFVLMEKMMIMMVRQIVMIVIVSFLQNVMKGE